MSTAPLAPQPAAVLAPDWLGFLSDEERVPHDDASAVNRALAMLDLPGDDPDHLFVAANLLSLVLFRRGRLPRAQELCRAEIAFARDCPPGPRRARVSALALQPQVNLLRIEGYVGDADRCLAGLAALEQVAEGRAVDTDELHWSPDDVATDPELERRVRLLARNIRVADTCKILLRRGRTSELLHEAARFTTRWPDLAARGLQHAAEAPWAALPGEQAPPAPGELGSGPRPARRLAFVRGLHCAAHGAYAAQAGHAVSGCGIGIAEQARELALHLDACLPALAAEGPWASTLTVPRWQGVLGSTLVLVGELPRGLELMCSALAFAEAGGDTALAGGVRQRLAAAHAPRPDPGPVPGAGPQPTLEARIDLAVQRLTRALGHPADQDSTEGM